MKVFQILVSIVILFLLAATSGCAAVSEKMSSITSGGGDSAPISGTAVSSGDGQKTASTGSNTLARCSKNYGRIAIEENPMNTHVMSALGLSSPAPLARHAILQSGCFTVVDRGAAYEMGERERKISGEMGSSTERKTSTARWVLRVEVPQPTTQTGGGAAGLLGLVPGLGGMGAGLAMVAGSVRFSEAYVLLTVVDMQTSEIVASVTGTGKSTDLGIGGGLLSGVSAMGGAWGKSPAGKVVAAGFVDAINQLVPVMENVVTVTSEPPPPAVKQKVAGKKVYTKK